MKPRKKELLACITSLLALALVLCLLTPLLTPKQHEMGATWGHFLQEEPHSVDVMFFGSSLVYCDVAPAALWEASGLTSYVMAGPEQTIPITYYYIREALRTQSPQAVFVEITGVFYNRYTNYTKTNIGQMPWGANRLQATFQEAEPELRGGLLFPLYFYHDRWRQLTADDFRVALSGYGRDPLAGFTHLDVYGETNGIYTRAIPKDLENRSRNVSYLEKIHALCQELGITPVFYIAPTLGRIPDEAMEPLKAQVQAMDGAVLLDCNAHFADIGADETRDFHDTLHYNTAGAVKFSTFLGSWITETLALTPRPGQDEVLWQSRAQHLRQLATKPMAEKSAQ